MCEVMVVNNKTEDPHMDVVQSEDPQETEQDRVRVHVGDTTETYTTVTEDTHVHEVMRNSDRKKDPHVVETYRDLSGLNTTIVEDTPVCEVLVVNSKNEDPHVDVVQSEDSQETEHERVRVGDNTICSKQQTKKRAVPSLDYKLTSYAAWWRRVEKDENKFYKEVRKEEEDRKKKKEESKGRQERKKDFVSKFFPKYENSPGGKPYLRGLIRSNDSSTLGAVGKADDEGTVVPNLPNRIIFETKVKTSTWNYVDRGQPIETFANPEITPAADLRKDGDYVDGAHLDQKD